MDRVGSTAITGVDLETKPAGAGWDARAVWATRVRAPHIDRWTARAGAKFVVEEPSAGWDPLQTWQLRVRRPRADSEH